MPHAVNRSAFLAAKSSGQPLLSAYCQLVATELALKDHGATWQRGHDVPQMIDNIADAGLTSLSAQLRLKLSSIPCTDQTGNTASVSPNNYPTIRYAHHINDRTGGTTNNHLQSLVDIVEEIIVQLRAKGVAI